MFHTIKNRILCSVTVAVLLATPAHADVDAKALADALTTKLTAVGWDVKIGSAEKSGANVTLKNIEVTFHKNKKDAKPNKLAEVTLENVTEKDGGYLIGQIAAPAGNYPVKDGAWDFGGLALKNIKFSGTDTNPWVLFETWEMKPTVFKTDAGREAIKFGALTMKISSESEPISFTMMPVEFSIDTAAIPTTPDKKQTADALAQFGLTELKGSLATKGTWNRKDGRIVSDMSIDLANAGKFTYAADLSGYTEEFMKAVAAMPSKSDATEKPTDDTTSGEKTEAETEAAKKEAEAAAMAMLGLMQNVTLNSMSMRFDDHSITSKLIDKAAEERGLKREDIVAQIKAMATLLSVAAQDPDLITSISKATSDFLDNPKSFEIRLAPAQPVPLTLLAAVGMTDPSALIKQLNLQILANQ